MNATWLIEKIEQLAQFGKRETGVTRLAFSKEDQLARKFILQEMQEIGLNIKIDGFGNIFGRLEGTHPELPAVATGSHMDSVPEGGKYDGPVGVIAALSAIRELKTRGPLTNSVEMIVFSAEESSRFGYATMGSKVMAGTADLKAWQTVTDSKGITLPEALASCGFDFNQLVEARREPGEWKAFIEIHIEQGPVLDLEKIKIGIVSGIAAPTRLKLRITGVANHSGTTPMDCRHDASISAAQIILAVREAACREMQFGTVGTVGSVKVTPGVMNVVPGFAELLVDIRGVEDSSIQRVVGELRSAVEGIAKEQGTPTEIIVLSADHPVPLDSKIESIIENSCKKLGFTYRHMHSGAGHDAMHMATLTPTGMIFIPCRDGISHNYAEYATPEDIEAGAAVLLETLYVLAK